VSTPWLVRRPLVRLVNVLENKGRVNVLSKHKGFGATKSELDDVPKRGVRAIPATLSRTDADPYAEARTRPQHEHLTTLHPPNSIPSLALLL
jgi:hypothetical protein